MNLDWLGNHDFILWVQKASNPALDAFFLALTRCGDMFFFALIFPYLFWCWNREESLKLMTIFLISTVTVYFFKEFFSLLRPDLSVVKDYHLTVAPRESFPSGHAVGAAVFWGYLALRIRRIWMTFAALSMALLISFSRIYLGVHFPRDVVAGLAWGCVLLFIYEGLGRRAESSIPLVWSGVLLALALGTVFFYRENRVLLAMGMLAGIRTGPLLENRWQIRPFSSSGLRPLLRYAAGIGGIFALYKAAALFPGAKGQAAQFMTAFFSGFYLAFLYPWLTARFSKEPA